MVFVYFVLLVKSVSCFVNLTDIRAPVDANYTLIVNGNFTIEGVDDLCENRESVCKGAGNRVCAKRVKNSTEEYKDFSNACFLFMGNLCEYSDDVVPIFNDTPTMIYEVLMAIDGHPCPLSCPNTYEPWCIYANPNDKYVKIYKFANHCAMDAYYCKNWSEFEPPPELLAKNPDEFTSTDQFPLKNTGCASQRYNKILKAYERNPAFG